MGTTSDGDGFVEEREAEESETFGDEEEMGGVVEVEEIRSGNEF